MSNWIKISRDLKHSEIWQKPDAWLKIWMYILMEVNHSETKQMPRGTGFFMAKSISFATGTSRHQVESMLKWGRSTEMLTTERTTRGMFITALNYDVYQGSENSKTETKPERNRKTTETKPERNRNETRPITKERKNEERKNEEYNVATEVANYLLEKIMSSNSTFKTPNIKTWTGDIDKAMRIDGRTKQQLFDCIDWIYSPAGSFWQPNILSGKKLREKFDMMNAQSMNTRTNRNISVAESWKPDENFQRMFDA